MVFEKIAQPDSADDVARVVYSRRPAAEAARVNYSRRPAAEAARVNHSRHTCCIYFSKTVITLPHYLAALLPRKSAVVAIVMPFLAFFERIRWERLTAGAVIAVTG